MLTLLGLAVISIAGALAALASRRQRVITVSSGAFRVGEIRVEKSRVKQVRPDIDLRFKGVSIDLIDNQSVRVPAHVHRQSRVLRASEVHGYPVLRK